MTPGNIRYENAYAQAYPFNRIVDGMVDPAMIRDTAWLMHQAIEKEFTVNVIVNNRAGGNAPQIAQMIRDTWQGDRPVMLLS